jgi:hypothetical protein
VPALGTLPIAPGHITLPAEADEGFLQSLVLDFSDR